MPFDAPLALPHTARVKPSAAIELSWLMLSCKDKVAHRIPPELEAESDAFWGDGERSLTELLVIAQQVDCLTGWDIEPLFSLAGATLDPDAEMDLSTEPLRERRLVHDRIRRLAGDAQLRAAYSDLLRRIWDEASPVIYDLGRPTVERAVLRACASMEHGQSPLEVVGGNHIARREKFAALTENALRDGTLLLSPCYIAGGHGHIVALPGFLSVAIGTGVTTDMARSRAVAERVARGLKLLSDPTRLLILTELDREAATVGEIAQRVGVAQPTASVHVRQLREAGLLTATRDGASSSYAVERARVREVLEGAHDALLGEPSAVTS
ncbi:MAG TPA: metalloregulator ArsR/SmtB family transcription factor [Gaiellales bacterium]|jgi:DNA-binding transcriptional ArsR family regulator